VGLASCIVSSGSVGETGRRVALWLEELGSCASLRLLGLLGSGV